MKRKGMYTGTIALIAVFILVFMAFGMVSDAQAQETKGYAKAIVELKWEWQNARHVLGKSFSDALSDEGFAQGCSFDLAGVQGRTGDAASGYLASALDDSWEGCQLENVSVEGDEGSARVSFNLACRKELEGMSAEYRENAVAFDKHVYFSTDALGCHVDVEDNDTLKCEVDTIVGGGCGS